MALHWFFAILFEHPGNIGAQEETEILSLMETLLLDAQKRELPNHYGQAESHSIRPSLSLNFPPSDSPDKNLKTWEKVESKTKYKFQSFGKASLYFPSDPPAPERERKMEAIGDFLILFVIGVYVEGLYLP